MNFIKVNDASKEDEATFLNLDGVVCVKKYNDLCVDLYLTGGGRLIINKTFDEMKKLLDVE